MPMGNLTPNNSDMTTAKIATATDILNLILPI